MEFNIPMFPGIAIWSALTPTFWSFYLPSMQHPLYLSKRALHHIYHQFNFSLLNTCCVKKKLVGIPKKSKYTHCEASCEYNPREKTLNARKGLSGHL